MIPEIHVIRVVPLQFGEALFIYLFLRNYHSYQFQRNAAEYQS